MGFRGEEEGRGGEEMSVKVREENEVIGEPEEKDGLSSYSGAPVYPAASVKGGVMGGSRRRGRGGGREGSKGAEKERERERGKQRAGSSLVR